MLSADSGIPTCGAPKTIQRLSKRGKCCLVDINDILQAKLPSQCNTGTDPSEIDSLHALSCFLGNDFIERKSGNGVAMAKNDTMKEFVGLDSGGQEEYVMKYFDDDLPKIVHWNHVMSFLKYVPAFIMKPTTESMTPCEVFFSKELSYELALAPMDGTTSPAIWDENGLNKIRFDPIGALKENWINPDSSNDNMSLYLELFILSKWA